MGALPKPESTTAFEQPADERLDKISQECLDALENLQEAAELARTGEAFVPRLYALMSGVADLVDRVEAARRGGGERGEPSAA